MKNSKSEEFPRPPLPIDYKGTGLFNRTMDKPLEKALSDIQGRIINALGVLEHSAHHRDYESLDHLIHVAASILVGKYDFSDEGPWRPDSKSSKVKNNIIQ